VTAIRIDPGQGHTRWALEHTLVNLQRYLPAATGDRRRRMQTEIKALRKALKG